MDLNPNAIIIIKSTVLVEGYSVGLRKIWLKEYYFNPEFLRKSRALYDNLYPSRISVDADMSDQRLVDAKTTFINLLKEAALKEKIETLTMKFTEAEEAKLFVNTHLALRVSFLNELDT